MPECGNRYCAGLRSRRHHWLRPVGRPSRRVERGDSSRAANVPIDSGRTNPGKRAWTFEQGFTRGVCELVGRQGRRIAAHTRDRVAAKAVALTSWRHPADLPLSRRYPAAPCRKPWGPHVVVVHRWLLLRAVRHGEGDAKTILGWRGSWRDLGDVGDREPGAGGRSGDADTAVGFRSPRGCPRL